MNRASVIPFSRKLGGSRFAPTPGSRHFPAASLPEPGI
jgi:hypothetical protein